MSKIPEAVKTNLTILVRQKINVDRFMKIRTDYVLGAELGVSAITIRASLKRGRASGKLSPDEVAYVRLMVGERRKHKREARDNWTVEAVARRAGVSRWTAQRYYERERFASYSPRF